ncbi:MAG: MarR family winged helix-turn-helix transcriptional regulator [Alkalispirochaetaceae bacterium]
MSNRDLSVEVLETLRKIIRAIDIHSRKLSKEFGLTGPQLVVIKEIASKGPVSIGAVARGVSLSQATVTSILDRLEQRGFVRRDRSSEDRRRVLVNVTEKATDVLESNPNFLQDEFLRRFNALAEWEQSLILSSIQRIAAMMDATDLKVDPILGSVSDHDLPRTEVGQATPGEPREAQS